jgi:hypothetical protein
MTQMLGQAAGDELGSEVEMELNAIGDYHPAAPKANGMQGEYGSVNIMHGTSVDIMMTVRHAKSHLNLKIPHVALTFFDLDEGPDGKCQESVTVGGFTDIIVTDKTEVIQEKEADGRTSFKASTYGTGEDNPENPMFLTDQQKNRAVSLIFDKFHEHKVTLAATHGATPRFFTFIGRPSLLCAATVQEGYKPTSTTPPPKYPPLKYGPMALMPVTAPKHMTFVRWMVGMHQRVNTGDVIAMLAPDKYQVKATHPGMVVAKAPLKHGDFIDDRMVDHNIATLDETLKPLEYDPDAGEDAELAKRKLHFVRWLKAEGETVTEGTPIAQVSSGNFLLLHYKQRKAILKMKPTEIHPAGGFPEMLGTVYTVPATEDGVIIDTEPFIPGDVIGEVKQNKHGEAIIAVIGKGGSGIPWMLIGLIAAAVIAIVLFLMMYPEKKKETYKALPQPPPPPPPPRSEPAGLRFDFDDHKGNTKTIYATMRPLGITIDESAPITVKDLTFNSYAKSLGVQPGWTIIRVGSTDVKDKTDFKEVAGLVNNGLAAYPCYPLKMELVKSGTAETKTFEFACRPLGFEFDNKAPIKVKRVYPNSYALSLEMKDFQQDQETWTVTKIADIACAPDNHNFQTIFQYMKDGTKALDPYTESDGVKSLNQFHGWD